MGVMLILYETGEIPPADVAEESSSAHPLDMGIVYRGFGGWKTRNFLHATTTTMDRCQNCRPKLPTWRRRHVAALGVFSEIDLIAFYKNI